MPTARWSPAFGGSSSSAAQAARVLSAEMVDAPLPAAVGSKAGRHRPLRLGPFDGFNLRLWYIEATYFFEEQLDLSALRSSLCELLARYPCFAGRARKRRQQQQPTNGENTGADSLWAGYSVVTDSTTSESSSSASGVPLIEIAVDGSVSEAMVDSSHRDSHGFANMPDLAEAAGGGRPFSETTPLMTVTVVKFGKGGGSALAVAVSHGLVDGKGFAELMRAWSFGHEYGWDHPNVPVLIVERPSCLLDGGSTSGRGSGGRGAQKAVRSAAVSGTGAANSSPPAGAERAISQTPPPASADSENSGACVCDVRTAQGFEQHVHGFEPMVWNAAGRRRARVYFAWDEMRALKTKTRCASSHSAAHTPSAKRTITPTSTEALGARIWLAFSDIVFPVPLQPEEAGLSPSALTAAAGHKAQPYLLAHMRFPRHPEIPAQFLGNCVEELSGDIVDTPTDLGAVCGQFHAASETARDASALTKVIAAHEAKIRGLNEGVLPAIGSAPSANANAAPVHRYQLNAKQSFRVMDHAWGAGQCVGVIPLNAGADLQIIDAPGGVHVYLGCPSWASETAPADWIEQVETSTFRTRVLTMAELGSTHLRPSSTTVQAGAAGGIKFKAAALAVLATVDFAKRAPLANLRQLRKTLEGTAAGVPTTMGAHIGKSRAFHSNNLA